MRHPPYVVLYKPVGQTPLETLLAWKAAHPEYQDMPASYAGRLDPMASGLLLILLGEECKRQKAYTGLDKEYEIEVLLGIGSDTGDVLGITRAAAVPSIGAHQVTGAIRKELGTHMRAYPVFSSKTVRGKPLFLYALEGTLHTVVVPTHPETIHRITLLETFVITREQLQARVSSMLRVVPRSTEPSKLLGADFRIDTVQAAWTELLDSVPTEHAFRVLRLRITCGSGAYMRTLAGALGTSLGTQALALSIARTRLGVYVPIVRGFGFWLRSLR